MGVILSLVSPWPVFQLSLDFNSSRSPFLVHTRHAISALEIIIFESIIIQNVDVDCLSVTFTCPKKGVFLPYVSDLQVGFTSWEWYHAIPLGLALLRSGGCFPAVHFPLGRTVCDGLPDLMTSDGMFRLKNEGVTRNLGEDTFGFAKLWHDSHHISMMQFRNRSTSEWPFWAQAAPKTPTILATCGFSASNAFNQRAQRGAFVRLSGSAEAPYLESVNELAETVLWTSKNSLLSKRFMTFYEQHSLCSFEFLR